MHRPVNTIVVVVAVVKEVQTLQHDRVSTCSLKANIRQQRTITVWTVRRKGRKVWIMNKTALIMSRKINITKKRTTATKKGIEIITRSMGECFIFPRAK